MLFLFKGCNNNNNNNNNDVSCPVSIPKLGLNPTSIDSVVVGKGNEVKMKPGQQLHIVNQLYPYTVQFKEDPSGNHSSTKRPRETTSEDRESHREAPSMKAAKQPESISHGEATKTSVRKETMFPASSGKGCVLVLISKMLFL